MNERYTHIGEMFRKGSKITVPVFIDMSSEDESVLWQVPCTMKAITADGSFASFTERLVLLWWSIRSFFVGMKGLALNIQGMTAHGIEYQRDFDERRAYRPQKRISNGSEANVFWFNHSDGRKQYVGREQ